MTQVFPQVLRGPGSLPAQQVTWSWVTSQVDPNAHADDLFILTGTMSNATAGDPTNTVQYVLQDAETLRVITQDTWQGGVTDRQGRFIKPLFSISDAHGLPAVMIWTVTLSKRFGIGMDITVRRVVESIKAGAVVG